MNATAQTLRANASAAEAEAGRALRSMREEGVHVRRQHPIGRFIVDFAIVKARLAIELDGPLHAWRVERDRARQNYIENMGWRVLRITTQEGASADRLLDLVRGALPLAFRSARAAPRAPAGAKIRRTRAARALKPRRKS